MKSNPLGFASIAFAVSLSLLLLILFIYSPEEWKWELGTHPRNWSYWYTSFTGGFFHGDAKHLFGNLVSLLGLAFIFWLLYPTQGIRFFLWQWPISGFLLFFLGDLGENHIGASTWVYAYVGFLGVQTLKIRNTRVRALFLALCLWYGSAWWGLLPVQPGVSHEGHIAGMLTGVLIALGWSQYWNNHLRNELIYIPKIWENEEGEGNPYDKFS